VITVSYCHGTRNNKNRSRKKRKKSRATNVCPFSHFCVLNKLSHTFFPLSHFDEKVWYKSNRLPKRTRHKCWKSSFFIVFAFSRPTKDAHRYGNVFQAVQRNRKKGSWLWNRNLLRAGFRIRIATDRKCRVPFWKRREFQLSQTFSSEIKGYYTLRQGTKFFELFFFFSIFLFHSCWLFFGFSTHDPHFQVDYDAPSCKE